MKIKPNELKAILADYESHAGDPMDADDPKVAQVKKALASLSQAQRTVFILHVDGYTFRQLSTMFNVSRETIRVYYNKTLEIIRNTINTK